MGVSIRLRDVSKVYRVYARPIDRLKEAFLPGRRHREIRVLDQISLEVAAGQTVGIVGRNGAGKSTLLKIVAGTTRPTSGAAEVRGSVAALLELGGGFNPEVSGRENVYLNASIHGLSKAETDQRYEAIVEYSELGDFVDQPVKTYSSGMLMRLAFATAIHVQRDILIVDESLAVGDAMFQRKCMTTIEEIKDSGATILFVSHSLETVKALCDRAVLLEQGRLVAEGLPIDVLNEYARLIAGVGKRGGPLRPIGRPASQQDPPPMMARRTEAAACRQAQALMVPLDLLDVGKEEYGYGTGDAEITDVETLDASGRATTVFQSGDEAWLRYTICFAQHTARPHFGMTITRLDGVRVYGTNSLHQQVELGTCSGGERVQVEFHFRIRLVAGNYYITVGCADVREDKIVFLHRRCDLLLLKVLPNAHATGIADLSATIGTRRLHQAAA
ncbi:MAG: ABC transporter ATP-binding protein [Pirellulales bacterium]